VTFYAFVGETLINLGTHPVFIFLIALSVFKWSIAVPGYFGTEFSFASWLPLNAYYFPHVCVSVISASKASVRWFAGVI
jgi:hypothetical protein